MKAQRGGQILWICITGSWSQTLAFCKSNKYSEPQGYLFRPPKLCFRNSQTKDWWDGPLGKGSCLQVSRSPEPAQWNEKNPCPWVDLWPLCISGTYAFSNLSKQKQVKEKKIEETVRWLTSSGVVMSSGGRDSWSNSCRPPFPGFDPAAVLQHLKVGEPSPGMFVWLCLGPSPSKGCLVLCACLIIIAKGT